MILRSSLLLLSFLLFSCSKGGRLCVTNVKYTTLEFQISSRVPEGMLKKWMHSYEDDKGDDIKNYRPDSYHFPLSRGRTGFEFLKTGKFIEYAIGPDDRPLQIEGHWVYTSKSKMIDVSFKKMHATPIPDTKEEKPGYTFEIIKLDSVLLQVKKTFEEKNVAKSTNQ